MFSNTGRQYVVFKKGKEKSREFHNQNYAQEIGLCMEVEG